MNNTQNSAVDTSIYVEIQQIAVSDSIPDEAIIKSWVKAALIEESAQHHIINKDQQELTIRIVDKDEMQGLNKTYRHQDKTTNVLSFPFEAPPAIQSPLLGDIIICHDVVVEEAEQQQKSLFAHWAHMVIHGVLHLKGYDHIQDSEAEIMETLEIHILEQLGFANPYF